MKATITVTLWMMSAVATAADVTTQPTLTLDGARRVADAAIAYARAHAAPGAAVAVVDAGGHPMYLARLDGTFAAGAEISIGKARTAVMFRRATRGIEDTINKGRTAMTPVAAVTWFTPLQGGVPIMVGQQIVGGIGVSGASSAQQDEEVATAGAQAIQGTGDDPSAAAPSAQSPPARSPSTPGHVNHVTAEAVSRAFREGQTGGTLVSEPAFRVNASRRDGAGEAELHTHDTDIFYVLEGSATVVTGGEIIGAHEVAPGEIRGTGLEGGTSYHIAKGDVFTIQNGVPHWFKSVATPFRYYVIKSVSGS